MPYISTLTTKKLQNPNVSDLEALIIGGKFYPAGVPVLRIDGAFVATSKEFANYFARETTSVTFSQTQPLNFSNFRNVGKLKFSLYLGIRSIIKELEVSLRQWENTSLGPDDIFLRDALASQCQRLTVSAAILQRDLKMKRVLIQLARGSYSFFPET